MTNIMVRGNVPASGKADVVLSEEGVAVCAETGFTKESCKKVASPRASDRRIRRFIAALLIILMGLDQYVKTQETL